MIAEWQQEIKGCRARILALRQDLPFADGPAYSQDVNRIAQLESKIAELQLKILEASGGPNSLEVP